MSADKRVDNLSLASPVVASACALYMAGCGLLAHCLALSSATALATCLLKAGFIAFLAGEVFALVLGVVGGLRVLHRRAVRGGAEAATGIIGACLYCVTALVLFLPNLTCPFT